jgi:hypothetical protein
MPIYRVIMLYHKPCISSSLSNSTQLYVINLLTIWMTWYYWSNYWLVTCDPIRKLSSATYCYSLFYIDLRIIFMLLISSFLHVLLSHIKIHNENYVLVFGAVHKLGCHIIMFQSWTSGWQRYSLWKLSIL